jgi:cell division protein FtsA
MNTENYIIAIDAGTANVVALAGRPTEDGRIELVTGAMCASEGFMRGDIKNIESSTKAIKQAITDLETELGIEISEAVVGMSGPSIKCRKQSGYVFVENNEGEVKEADLQLLNKSMLNAQVGVGESIIHISAQNYSVDGERDIRQPVGMMGKKLEAEFNIVTNDKAAVGRIEKCLHRVGVRAVGYVLNGVAAAEAVLSEDEKELGVVVVDIGAGTTDLAVYHDNIVRYVSVIPIGGDLINKDIRQAGILERCAEDLKLRGVAMAEYASTQILPVSTVGYSSKKGISQKNLSMIIEARLMDIIEAVQNELNKSGYAKLLEGGIVLTGGSARFDKIDELFSKSMKMPVRIASSSCGIDVGENNFYNDLSYIPAMGIMIKGVKDGLVTYTKAVEQLEIKKEEVKEVVVSKEEDPDEEYQNDETQEEEAYDEPTKKTVDVPKKFGSFIKNFIDKVNGLFEVVDEDKKSESRNRKGNSGYDDL